MIAWTIAVISDPNAKPQNFAVYVFWKPNFYKLTQLQQNITTLLECPKSLSNLFHCVDTLKVTSITAIGPRTQWYTRKSFNIWLNWLAVFK